MTTNYSVATAEMFGALNVNWQAHSAAIVGYIPLLYWPGVEQTDAPALDKYWARASILTVVEGDDALGSDGPGGTRYYLSAGNLFVQCFGPMIGDPQVMDRLRSLSTLAQNSFRGNKTASGVWFRNVRKQELGPDEKFYRINVIAEWQYQENA